MEAFDEVIQQIVDGVKNVLEKTPPELSADIGDRGIVLTGGGSLIYGLDTLLSIKTGLEVTIADDPISCVVLGTGEALDNLDKILKLKVVKQEERSRR